jgi:hypothetical protein
MFMWPAKAIASETSAVEGRPGTAVFTAEVIEQNPRADAQLCDPLGHCRVNVRDHVRHLDDAVI